MADEIAPEVAKTSPTPDDAEVIQDSAPAPEAPVEASPDSPPEPAESDSEAPKSRAQIRIEQLSAKAKDAEIGQQAALESAEYWRNKALEVPAEEPKKDPRPTLEGSEFDQDKFAEASSAWMEREVGRQTASQVAKALVHQAAKGEEETARAQWLERSAKFSAEHDDFNAIAYAPGLPLTKDMFSVIQELEKGPEIVYHLGKNVDIAARISRLKPAQQAAAIGRLEAELSKPAPKPQPSNAPEPPTSVDGSTPSVDISKLPIKDWMKERKAELRAEGRR